VCPLGFPQFGLSGLTSVIHTRDGGGEETTKQASVWRKKDSWIDSNGNSMGVPSISFVIANYTADGEGASDIRLVSRCPDTHPHHTHRGLYQHSHTASGWSGALAPLSAAGSRSATADLCHSSNFGGTRLPRESYPMSANIEFTIGNATIQKRIL